MPGPVAAAYFYEELYGTGDGDDAKEKKEPKVAPKVSPFLPHISLKNYCIGICFLGAYL